MSTSRASNRLVYYAVQPYFSDGHSTGLYSWDYLHWLGMNEATLWQEYLGRLTKAGASREPPGAGVPAAGPDVRRRHRNAGQRGSPESAVSGPADRPDPMPAPDASGAKPSAPGSAAHETHFGFETVPESGKASRVGQVFDLVASRYDMMNDLMSAGLHRVWKAFTVAQAAVKPGMRILDVAGGTGDLSGSSPVGSARLERSG